MCLRVSQQAFSWGEKLAEWGALHHSNCNSAPAASGSSSVAERQLPKLNVAGSIPVSRSK
jgi:hypothetical protein